MNVIKFILCLQFIITSYYKIFFNFLYLDIISKYVYYCTNISISITYFIFFISIATIALVTVHYSSKKIIGKVIEGAAFGAGAWGMDTGLDAVKDHFFSWY